MNNEQVRPGAKVPLLVPTHCEAYPSFAMSGMAKHLREGERYCEWYDEHGGLAGQMDAEMLDESRLYILYSIGAATYRDQRGQHFAVALHRQLSGRTELRVHCPACHKLTVKVFYKGQHWACQGCQHLVERRALLTERDRLILRRETLIERVHALPKPSRGYHMWERDRRELIAIEEAYAAACKDVARPEIAYPLRHALRSFWFSREEDRTERETHETPAAYLDLK